MGKCSRTVSARANQFEGRVLNLYLSIPRRLIFASRAALANTQLCCGTRRPGDRAAAAREGSFDHFLFLIKQCACHPASRSCDFWLLPLKPGIVDGESVTVSQDDPSLNYVLKFANVSRPGIRLKKPKTLFSNSPEFLPGFLRKAVNKILDQQRNVLCSILQRWHGDRYNIKPV